MVSSKFIFAITAGPKAGKNFVFEEHDTLLFGRAGDCQACLPGDQQVSRHHFLLEINPPEARLRDLGSRNGTYINGQKHGGRARHETPEEGARRQYPQVDLHDGDEIKVGQTILQVRVEAIQQPAEMADSQHCSKEVSAAEAESGKAMPLSEADRTSVPQGPVERLAEEIERLSPHDQQNIAFTNYAIEVLLGEGGMGAVYLARHKQTEEQVAVKVLRSRIRVDERARQRFLREIEATRTLRHPHLVQFLAADRRITPSTS